MSVIEGLTDETVEGRDPMAVWAAMWRLPMETAMQMGEAATAMTASMFRVSMGDVVVNYPFGNGYTQVIEPATNWGFIGDSATDRPDVEEEIARDVASYGRQLGRMMDLLLDIARNAKIEDPETLKQVKELKDQIETVKAKRG